jgi:hypothetical protein
VLVHSACVVDLDFAAISASPTLEEIMPEISPEVLSKLADLIKTTGAAGSPHSPFLEYLKGATDFFNSVAWPAAAVLCVLLFRQQVTKFLGDVETVKVFGAEISRKLKQSADEAGAAVGLSSAPSEGELIRATELEKSAAAADKDTIEDTIEKQAEELAAEYERVRHSMLPGDPRTRQMEVVVSKMRTLARAFYPLRLDFAESISPGKRLMTIAALQVDPDYDLLDWLADRLAVEKPFVGYHAVVALLLAVRAPKARGHIAALESAVEKANRSRSAIQNDTDRVRTLDDVNRALAALKQDHYIPQTVD